MTKEAGERSFDELASGLASGTLSRGKALRLMGAALVGSVLAFIPGVAEAANPCGTGNRACGRNEFGQPICYDPDVFFCCKTRAVFGTVSNICTRATEQCCITANGAQCQTRNTFCPGRVRAPRITV